MLRVHIQNDRDELPALQLQAARLQAAAALRPALAGQLDISEDYGGTLLPDAMADCEVLFSTVKLSLRTARGQARNLRWTQVTSAGVESYLPDLPADLVLTNASGAHGEKGGEFVLAAALMLTSNIPQFVTDKERGVWRPVFGSTLSRKTVAILGVGAVGSAAVRALRPFGCRLVGITRGGSAAVELDAIVNTDGLDAVMAEADILVSTLPLTPHTKGLVDRRRIGLLPAGAGVVVVGRAGVLDYDALLDALDVGALGGAVLDVFPDEPIPPNDRLWRTPRLIITPHCSVDDHSVYIERCLEIFLDNLERYLAGAPLSNVVDPGLGY